MTKDLAKMVRFARKHGLKRLKSGTIEIEFFTAAEPKTRKANIGNPLSTDFREPTEDELLMWSTPTFDQIRAERQNAKERN